jgi:predicted ATPase
LVNYIEIYAMKAIDILYLNNLGHLNVICGKNNSGKSSVLEAMSMKEHYQLGKTIKAEDEGWIYSKIAPVVEGFSLPLPKYTEPWIRALIQKAIAEKYIFYDNESEGLHHYLSNNQDDYLKGFNIRFDFHNTHNVFFEKSNNNYRPILIPPKRTIESTVGIDSSQYGSYSPTGMGVVNRLFYLKSQDDYQSEHKEYENILKSFINVTGYEFSIIPKTDNKLLTRFSLRKEHVWYEASDCGMGLSDVLVILTFAYSPDNTFLLVDEPENHLHPDMQKRLINCLSEIKSKQFMFSTHSNVFLNPYVVDEIYYAEIEDGKVKLNDETNRAQILNNLGYSTADNIVSDVLILTEGPTDIPVLTKIFSWFELMQNYNIKFWPMGGDIMDSLDLSVFSERNNVVVLLDKDPKSSKIRTSVSRKCKELGIYCHRLQRYAIENYFTFEAIKSVYTDISLNSIDVNEKLDDQLGFSKNKKTIKVNNSKIIEHMTIKDIEGTDMYKFCNQVKIICEKANSNKEQEKSTL